MLLGMFLGCGVFQEGMLTCPVSSAAPIHVLRICAMFGLMNGTKMSGDGSGWRAIAASANNVRGPHSFECGRNVTELQCIHMALSG